MKLKLIVSFLLLTTYFTAFSQEKQNMAVVERGLKTSKGAVHKRYGGTKLASKAIEEFGGGTLFEPKVI